MSKYDPKKDIPDLSGKAILITGGKPSFLTLASRYVAARKGKSSRYERFGLDDRFGFVYCRLQFAQFALTSQQYQQASW